MSLMHRLDGFTMITNADLELLVEGAERGVRLTNLHHGGTGALELLAVINGARQILSCDAVAGVAMSVASVDEHAPLPDTWVSVHRASAAVGVSEQAIRRALTTTPPRITGRMHRGRWLIDPESLQEVEWHARARTQHQ